MHQAKAERFIRDNTSVSRPPLIPEIALHLATEITPLWHATESELAARGLPPPYWAFAWVGGQALARHILDHPEIVRAKRVLDFATGSGIVAIAAAQAGAVQVAASDLDSLALAALALNAETNGVTIEILAADVTTGAADRWDVVLAGDVCYERPMAERVVPWLRRCVAAGAEVLLGDPGRAYLPETGVDAVACYTVPTTRELEDRESRDVTIYRIAA